jgi:uncharacterized membrane protein YhaH (DUF805 family)
MNNPYAAPTAKVADVHGAAESQPVKIFSAAGRIGRVRYIGYSVGLGMLVNILMTFVLAIGGEMVGGVLGLGLGIAFFVVAILLTIQRCHDFDASGWWTLIAIIPIINFAFWFIPGTDGPNRFGNKTPPNGIGAILLACIVPAIAVLGILAAIAIPAYQGYAKRAKGAALEMPHRVAVVSTPARI